jgi:hypothetical protein
MQLYECKRISAILAIIAGIALALMSACVLDPEEELVLALSSPPTPAPTPVPTPPPKGIGQRALTANWEIVVLKKPWILVQYRDFRGTPIAVKVRVTNIGNEGSTIYGNQFELEDGTGRVYKITSTYEDKALLVEDINPGLQYEGFVLFDVPESALYERTSWHLVVDGAIFQKSAIIDLSSPGSWTDMR